MVRHPDGVDARRKRLEPGQIIHIERRGGGDGEQHAVHHHRITLADLIEHAEWLAAPDHVILRDHLEPVDVGRPVQDLRIVLESEA